MLNTGRVHLVKQRFPDLIYVPVIAIFHYFIACSLIALQNGSSGKGSVIIGATKRVGGGVFVAHITYWLLYLSSRTVFSYFCTLRLASSPIMFHVQKIYC